VYTCRIACTHTCKQIYKHMVVQAHTQTLDARIHVYAWACARTNTGRIASQAIQMISGSDIPRARVPKNDEFIIRQTRGKGAGAVGAGGRGTKEVRHTLPTTERPGLWWKSDQSTRGKEIEGGVRFVDDGVSVPARAGACLRLLAFALRMLRVLALRARLKQPRAAY
jgi:hypothetical protein